MSACIFYTLDEIASKVEDVISIKIRKEQFHVFRENNFMATPTSFSPTGFRTNATINEILSTIFETSQ